MLVSLGAKMSRIPCKRPYLPDSLPNHCFLPNQLNMLVVGQPWTVHMRAAGQEIDAPPPKISAREYYNCSVHERSLQNICKKEPELAEKVRPVLAAILKSVQYELQWKYKTIRIAGGAVLNILRRFVPRDLAFVTTEQMIEIFKWLGLDGILYDYFNGFNDLKDRKVIFVGNPDVRIMEDSSRILRYFRSYGRIKTVADDHDSDTLQVIQKNTSGLIGIVGKLIWVGLKKIMKGSYAAQLLEQMVKCKVTEHIVDPHRTVHMRAAGQETDAPPPKRGVREYSNYGRSLQNICEKVPGLTDKIRPVLTAILTPELRELQRICNEYDMTIRIAGGAVRDIVRGITPHDLDFATTSHPKRMIEIFNSAGVRIIEYGTRAIEHGTVTVRINDKENYEITTTRSDVATDGRHVKTVEFHEDWERDANRRDLTFNSMFLDLDGTLFDYFNGFNDLKDRKVLFVVNPEERITEDHLRILRYFRFYGRIKTVADDHDSDTLRVIQKNASGLKGIAGERIWVELKNIMKGAHADHLLEQMVKCEVTEHIGLPVTGNTGELSVVYKRSAGYDIGESALLSAFLSSAQEVDELHKRLKLSKVEYNSMIFITEQRNSNYKPGNTKFYQDMIVDSSERLQCHNRCIQLAAYMGDENVYRELSSWEIPKLPFSAKVFLDLGIPKGKKLSAGVNRVKRKWKESNFLATAEELAAYAKQIVESGDLT